MRSPRFVGPGHYRLVGEMQIANRRCRFLTPNNREGIGMIKNLYLYFDNIGEDGRILSTTRCTDPTIHCRASPYRGEMRWCAGNVRSLSYEAGHKINSHQQ